MIETSGHLPECPCTAVRVPSCICDDYEECGSQCRHNCICDRLRACEARVFVDRTDHWNAALDAARGAVAAVEMGGEHFWSVGFRDGITIALAAIDALLKEKP